MTMVRKQVYITKEQDETLKRLAAQLGVTEAEVVRRGVEALVGELMKHSRAGAAEELAAMLREREERFPGGGGTTNWNREDLYYERLSRLSLR